MDLKSKMVDFAILLDLSDDDIKIVLSRTDTSLWAPALVHSRSEIRSRVFDNLARRPMELLKKEIRQCQNADFIVGSSAQAAVIRLDIGIGGCGSDQIGFTADAIQGSLI